jgi:hypothetical protein
MIILYSQGCSSNSRSSRRRLLVPLLRVRWIECLVWLILNGYFIFTGLQQKEAAGGPSGKMDWINALSGSYLIILYSQGCSRSSRRRLLVPLLRVRREDWMTCLVHV